MIVKMAYTNINRKCCACNVSKMKHYKYSIILECGSVSFGTLKTLRNSGLEINSNQSDIHICKSKLYEFLQFHTIVRTWFYYFVRLISYRTYFRLRSFLLTLILTIDPSDNSSYQQNSIQQAQTQYNQSVVWKRRSASICKQTLKMFLSVKNPNKIFCLQ